MQNLLHHVSRYVATPRGRHVAGQGPPGVRQQLRRVLEKPPDVGCPAQKGAAQHQAQTTLRVRTGIGQCQARTPGAAHHPPSLQAQLRAEALHVGDQLHGGVVRQRMISAAAAAAALIPQHHAGGAGIKKLAVPRHAAAARASMQKHHGQACRVAALLEIHGVPVLLGQEAVGEGFDRRKQCVWGGVWHGVHAMPFWTNASLAQPA